MAMLTAVVGATGSALATLGHLAGRSPEEQDAQIGVSSSTCVKTLGVALCLPAGCWRRATRHVSLMGELLVISRRPDSAKSSFQLHGTHVAWDGRTVKVISSSGATLATFWLNSANEAARWAKELASAATSLSKMVSLNRRQMQMDTIRSAEALWEAKIAMAQDSGTTSRTLSDELDEAEQEMNKLLSEVDSLTLTLDRHKIEGLEEISKDREGQIAVPQGHMDVELDKQLAQAAELSKQLSFSRKQSEDLVRQITESDESEAEQAAAVRLQVLHKRAQELPQFPIISSTTTSISQDPAVMEAVTRSSDTILVPGFSGKWSTRATLPACAGG
jgi:exonuclease VII small subunit